MSRYLVLGCRPWNRLAVTRLRAFMPLHQWDFGTAPADLETPDEFAAVFVLHWNWKIRPEHLARCPFVGFHMSNRRGGSPLQHAIANGGAGVLHALRLTDEIDAGPCLLSLSLSLDGAAEEIYLRADRLAVDMIARLLERERPFERREQDWGSGPRGPALKRRTPAQSRVPAALPLRGLHDHVRMLDAEGYPAAFVEVDGYRIELTRSALRHDAVVCDARITRGEP